MTPKCAACDRHVEAERARCVAAIEDAMKACVDVLESTYPGPWVAIGIIAEKMAAALAKVRNP